MYHGDDIIIIHSHLYISQKLTMNHFHMIISCDVSDDYDIDIFPNLIFMPSSMESIYCCYYCIYCYLSIFI